MGDFDEQVARRRVKFKREGNRFVPVQDDAEITRLLYATKPLHLEKLWKRLTPSYTRPLTVRDLGMMKHLAEACGGFEPAAIVIVDVVRDWAKFTARVEAATGTRRSPTAPTLRFLLCHAEEAVRMVFEGEPEAEPVQALEPAAVVAPSMEEAEMTPDERDQYDDLLDELT